ncbi:lysophospholipid acyltransferase family protein [Ascidiimonas sp. W6]|uniref:lysophospholipid acyltransferase family protein n=1 Tax=Ascidiimonas meishanensis TaxID=3128903 RepID=UPI0030EBA1BA
MIVLLRNLFYIIWRIWFYILVAIPIIILFPVLLVLSSRDKFYKQFFWLARNIWAPFVLFGMGFFPIIKKEEKIVKNKSYMLIANHTSMTDIMLMLRTSHNPFVFVGKKELAKIPLFGLFYKRVCIMVDRTSAKSRTAVYKRAQARLNSGLSICIFPEGGVPDDESILLDEFRDGAFRLAIEYQIPVVPISFADNKKRFPFRFFGGSMGKMRVQVHHFLPTKGMKIENKTVLKEQAYTVIKNQLKKFQKEKAA